jgi:hypothetical protein
MKVRHSAYPMVMVMGGIALMVVSLPVAFAQTNNCVAQILSNSFVCGGSCSNPTSQCGVQTIPSQNKMICNCVGASLPDCCYPAAFVDGQGNLHPSGYGKCDDTTVPPCPPTGTCSGGYKVGTDHQVEAICLE